jgi:serine/threonine protein kinase
MFEFLAGFPPFESKTTEDTYARITSVDLKFPESFSAEARDLISSMLQKDPKARLPLPAVANHPFIARNLPIFQANPSAFIPVDAPAPSSVSSTAPPSVAAISTASTGAIASSCVSASAGTGVPSVSAIALPPQKVLTAAAVAKAADA